MRRLILTTSDPGAGGLKQAQIADRVIAIAPRLVSGRPQGVDETKAFFGPRCEEDDSEDFHHWQNWIGFANEQRIGLNRPGLIKTCQDYDSVELWIDPDPNAQLILLQLLDYLSPQTDIISKLVLVQADVPIGSRHGWEIKAWELPRQKVEKVHVELAGLAWSAFLKPTPQAWFGLLTKDLHSLPHLRRAVLELLDELPAIGTGAGATEQMILKLISPGGVNPTVIFPGEKSANDLRVFDFWELGQILDNLAHCANPAVLGLEESPFDLDLMQDKNRWLKYKASKMKLSDLGRAVFEGREDFSRHNIISRFWGGTELTNGNLWRWDAISQTLLAPR